MFLLEGGPAGFPRLCWGSNPMTSTPTLRRARRLAVTIGAMLVVAGMAPVAEAASIERNAAASAFVGAANCRGGLPSPQCLAQPYDTSANLAFSGGLAAPAVAKDQIDCCSDIHQDDFANDGEYGNGASWLAGAGSSWIKVDLGSSAIINDVRIGRDRLGNFDDRDQGRFRILVSDTDDYAPGNDVNDGIEYTLVFDSADYGYDGSVNGAETIRANLDQARGRYVKIEITTNGGAIDEIEVGGSRVFPATTRDECKQGGWMGLTDTDGVSFRNQGDCVSFVATGGRNTAAG